MFFGREGLWYAFLLTARDGKSGEGPFLGNQRILFSFPSIFLRNRLRRTPSIDESSSRDPKMRGSCRALLPLFVFLNFLQYISCLPMNADAESGLMSAMLMIRSVGKVRGDAKNVVPPDRGQSNPRSEFHKAKCNA